MDVKIGNFRYVLDEIGMIGYCYDTSDRRLRYKELIIPGQVTYEGKTYRILEIGEGGFHKCKAERIIISDTIRLIRRDAFVECDNLKYVYIPKSVKVIERSCFEYCTNLSDVEFGGDISGIDFEPFAFRYSKIIRDNKCTETTIDDTYYFGNILYSVSPCVTKLNIKPGTKSVILESCNASDIIFPESVDFIYIRRLTDLERAYFPSIEHYLNIQLDTTLERNHKLVDLYFNGKLEKNIKLPQSTVSIGDRKFSGSSIESIIFNKDIKFVSQCFRRCLNLNTSSIYLPKKIESFWLDCDIYEVKFNYSTLVSRHGSLYYYINNLLIKTSLYSLVIYLDDISEVSAVHRIKPLDYIREVKLVITSSDIDIINLKKLLTVILTKAERAKITLIGEEFLKISDELDLTTNVIKVDDYLVPYYQNNPVWENFKITPRDDDDLSYIIVDSETCKVTYNLNTLGDNSYLGVIKIPREKEIDGKLYKVTGIDDFAFSDCYGLEEVVLYRDQEISELAFFNNPDTDIKITRI